MPTMDEVIADALRFSQYSGELQSAPSYGKPLAVDAGWEATPVELRMPYKILKDAGVLPPEVLMLQQAAALQAELDKLPDPDAAEAQALRQRLVEMRQRLALRFERLRISGTL
jgi:hypothetical protein